MTNSIDQARVKSFADRMMTVLNDGALALMISLGHRTGLFDAMAELPPSTSQQIADAADLNERYVREWLGAMVTGRIIEYSQTDCAYNLPREHAALLTREGTRGNMAVFAEYIPVLGIVEDEIVECFKNGGGVPYSSYPRFHQVMAEDSGQSVVAALSDAILPLVPGLVGSLENGITVLDVGCGSGRAVNVMARMFPRSTFFGYDISEEAVAAGRAGAEEVGLKNANFVVRDVTATGETECYDLITAFDAIHDQAWPAEVLKGISQALRPGGTFLMQDIRASSELQNNLAHPAGSFLYTISCMHCMTVSLSQNGEGLGAMWGEEKAREMLRDAGFARVDVKHLPHDFQNNYYIATKV